MVLCDMVMSFVGIRAIVLCGFLFFFKQKTAYEMRISDWSSDVCSSDLVSRRGWITADEGGLFVPSFCAGDRVPQGASLGEVIALDGTVTPEIGRASCRERVCQYV